MNKVELLAPVRHGISTMQGYIFVGDQLVAEATFTQKVYYISLSHLLLLH